MTPPEIAAVALQRMRRRAAPAIATVARRVPDRLKRDWHQFRLLSRDGVRQLLDAALFSRDSDPMQFALWMMALVSTPATFFAFRQALAYTALTNAPTDLVLQGAMAHRLFFGVYAMSAAALLAALTWEALFPDGRDQEILGVLPVKPYVFAASKLSAALLVGLGFIVFVNLPAALLYSAFAAGHPVFRGQLISLFAGHVLAPTLGALFVYLILLVLRGTAAIILGARAGAWLGALLQLVTIILLVEAVFFLPGVLGTLAAGVRKADARVASLPPIWFAGLHALLTGRDPVLAAAALRGLLALAAAGAIVVPVYLLPARWLGRRALETRGGERSSRLHAILRVISTVTGLRPAVRSMYVFAIISLVRSRRHLLVIATYLGVAIAFAIISILFNVARYREVLNAPREWALALPLLFTFFLVLGLRASFRIPTEIDANWPFRLTPPTVSDSITAATLVMLTLVITPVACLTVLALLPYWTIGMIAMAIILQVLTGLVLIEVTLFGWMKAPFASGHAPSPEVLKAKWPIYTVAMYVYAFKLSDWQFLALTSQPVLTVYLATAATALIVLRVVRWRQTKRQSLEFDPPGLDTLERLNLSGALN